MANVRWSYGLIGSIGEAILRSDMYFTDGEMTSFYRGRNYSLEGQGFPAWQMSDGLMDPSEKQSYGRTCILLMAN